LASDPAKRKNLAEAALERAIAEGNSALAAELAAANKRIGELEALLGRIASLAGGHRIAEQVVLPLERKALPAVLDVQPTTDPVPEGVDLAGEDNMGAGRWV
jgi:hypothetical protein